MIIEAAWHSYQEGNVAPLEEAVQPPHSDNAARSGRWAPVATPSAHRDLHQLETTIRRQMLAGLRRLLTGRRSNVQRYPDLEPPTWTLHDGSWQLVLRCSRQEREIVVLRVRQLRSASMTV